MFLPKTILCQHNHNPRNTSPAGIQVSVSRRRHNLPEVVLCISETPSRLHTPTPYELELSGSIDTRSTNSHPRLFLFSHHSFSTNSTSALSIQYEATCYPTSEYSSTVPPNTGPSSSAAGAVDQERIESGNCVLRKTPEKQLREKGVDV